MGWSIAVTYDRAHDFYHLVYRDVVLATPEDVARWVADLRTKVPTHPDPFDVIVDLSGLTVRPTALDIYDRERMALLSGRVRRAYRHHGSPMVRTRMMTSAARNHQAANVYATLDEAVAALLTDRARDGV